ncbi:MAG TPA: hypothetical protein VKY74_06415, partial [Chloroflexia bacterium]|nr:hypothetical protein [Chloroflexia bacterium]
MQKRLRHNRWRRGLPLICAYLLGIMALGHPPPGEASGAASTSLRPSSRPLVYQEQQGPDLCALLKQVAGSEPINISGGGLPDSGSCNAVSLESDHKKSKFAFMSVEKEDTPDAARALVAQKGKDGGC